MDFENFSKQPHQVQDNWKHEIVTSLPFCVSDGEEFHLCWVFATGWNHGSEGTNVKNICVFRRKIERKKWKLRARKKKRKKEYCEGKR